MGAYNVYLVDQVPSYARMVAHFPESTRTAVAAALQALFARVCETSSYTANVTWGAGVPAENELVCYFVVDRTHSIIDRLGGSPTAHAEGRSAQTPQGMVSEVYVSNAGPMAEMIAKTAFHELMHNKLDLPVPPRISSLHTHGGGGLASASIGPGSQLSDGNIRLMRAALGSSVPQYTGRMRTR